MNQTEQMLREALKQAVYAMRQPNDAWKGDCEALALKMCNEALAATAEQEDTYLQDRCEVQGELGKYELRDHEADWQRWAEVVCNEDGSINIEQLKKELSDFSMLIEGLPRLFMHVTGGQCSMPNTHASVVMCLHDDYFSERCEEEIRDAIEDYKSSQEAVPSQNAQDAGVREVGGWLQFIDGIKTQNFARDDAELKTIKEVAGLFLTKGEQVEYVPVYFTPTALKQSLAQPSSGLREATSEEEILLARIAELEEKLAQPAQAAVPESVASDLSVALMALTLIHEDLEKGRYQIAKAITAKTLIDLKVNAAPDSEKG